MTEVILPALDAQDRDLLVQHLFYQRYLLVEDLILKIQGCSRDNNLPAGQDRRNQVGQGLADPGFGLDNQHPGRMKRNILLVALEQVGHRLGHGKLDLNGPRNVPTDSPAHHSLRICPSFIASVNANQKTTAIHPFRIPNKSFRVPRVSRVSFFLFIFR